MCIIVQINIIIILDKGQNNISQEACLDGHRTATRQTTAQQRNTSNKSLKQIMQYILENSTNSDFTDTEQFQVFLSGQSQQAV